MELLALPFKLGSRSNFRAGYKVKLSLDATTETISTLAPLIADLFYTMILDSTIALALGAAAESVSFISF